MKVAIIFSLALATTIGCAHSSFRVARLSADELRDETAVDLCDAYAKEGRPTTVRAELIRRNAIPDDEWTAIDGGQIRIGMTELGLVCAWGYPGYSGAVNETATRSGISRQYVYRQCEACRGQYVYISGGRVTSWQQ